MAGGRGGLSPRAVLIIDVIAVWAPLTVVLWLVHRLDTGWGIIAAYLVLINGLAERKYKFASAMVPIRKLKSP